MLYSGLFIGKSNNKVVVLIECIENKFFGEVLYGGQLEQNRLQLL